MGSVYKSRVVGVDEGVDVAVISKFDICDYSILSNSIYHR